MISDSDFKFKPGDLVKIVDSSFYYEFGIVINSHVVSEYTAVKYRQSQMIKKYRVLSSGQIFVFQEEDLNSSSM